MRISNSVPSLSWVDALVKSHVKQAMQSADLNELLAWNADEASSGAANLRVLRKILGKISESLNDFSFLYKLGARNLTPEIVVKAKNILPDIDNIEAIRAAAAQTMTLLQDPIYKTQTGANILLHMAHMISNSAINPQQKAKFEQIAAGTLGDTQSFVEETDAHRMNNFLRQSIYSSGAADDKKTLRVIREILQNACDAAMEQSRRDPNHKPKVEINTWEHRDEQSMDIAITDNGVGMDWATLSDKFFRYFVSGKEGEKESAGDTASPRRSSKKPRSMVGR